MVTGKILLSSENPHKLQCLSSLLEEAKFLPICAKSGQETLTLAISHLPDAIVLDLEMTSMDPRWLVEKLREWYLRPILILSSPLSETETVLLLDIGVDSILSSPWDSLQFPAYIRAAIRLSRRLMEADNPTGGYRYKDLLIDFHRRLVQLGDKSVRLTPIEYRIVELLARNSGRVLSHRLIMERIWGPYHNENNKILRVNVTNIRRKLEPCPGTPCYILTENGVGYRMPPSEEND